MKLFLDTEFTRLHQFTTLISIGIVSEDGKMFYAEFTDYDKSQIDEWIQENVINNLILENPHHIKYHHEYDPLGNHYYDSCSIEMTGTSSEIREELTTWILQFKDVLIWSDCLAYDWVLFCQLLGPNLPGNMFYIPMDIATLFEIKGINPDYNREEYAMIKEISQKHNALWDAKIIKACHDKLRSDKCYEFKPDPFINKPRKDEDIKDKLRDINAKLTDNLQENIEQDRIREQKTLELSRQYYLG